MVQSVTSTDHLVCGGRAPLRNAAAPEVLRTDVTTQEFGMTVNNAGTYEFDLVEDARRRPADHRYFRSHLGYGNQQLI